jgi:hypothetical protein
MGLKYAPFILFIFVEEFFMEVFKDRNGKFTVRFDKPPAFLYINENGNGSGQLYTDGERFKGLQRVKIESETNTDMGIKPLKYSIQHLVGEIQPDLRIKPGIAVTGNMDEIVREVK